MTINPADGAGELVRRITDAPVTRPGRALNWRQKWTQDEIQTQSDELDGTTAITMQAQRGMGAIAKNYELVLRDALEVIGKDLDDAADKHLDEDDVASYRAGSQRELQFTGTRDIPAILAAVAPNNVDNLTTGLSSVQQLSNIGIGRVVARNRTAPEEPEPPRPVVVRRGFFGQPRQIEG